MEDFSNEELIKFIINSRVHKYLKYEDRFFPSKEVDNIFKQARQYNIPVPTHWETDNNGKTTFHTEASLLEKKDISLPMNIAPKSHGRVGNKGFHYSYFSPNSVFSPDSDSSEPIMYSLPRTRLGFEHTQYPMEEVD